MKRFLIVDDHDSNRYMLRALLEGHGHEVVEAFNGAEALEIARETPPDIVVSDLLMPVMDGFALCHEWKKDPQLKHLPFVVYTATYVEEKDELAAMNAGADRFLRKPTEPERFMEVIDEVLDQAASTGVRTSQWHHESEAYKLYNERLVRKLEKKMLEREREVAQRRQAEVLLLASQARLARAQAIAHVGDWRLEPEGDAMLWSDETARILGRPSTTTATRADFLETVHDDDRDEVARWLADPSRLEADPTLEHRVVHSDGSVHMVREKVEVTRADSGAVERIAGTLQDITQQWELELRLRQVQKLEAVGQLAGGVAHDFNNLLQAILSHLDSALLEAGDDPSLRQHLSDAARAAEEAASLAHQLLAFGRRQVLEPVPLDLNQLVEKVLRILSRLLGSEIEVVLDLAGEATVHADPGQLEWVLVNLCLNAREATPPGGRITIATEEVADAPRVDGHELRHNGRWLVLSVADTGAGMDEATATRVFEPFFSTKPEGEGSGLGLASAYGIVTQHRGVITVDSAPGQGSTFRVYLPIHP